MLVKNLSVALGGVVRWHRHIVRSLKPHQSQAAGVGYLISPTRSG
jgi:hypothetical protein